MNPAPFSLPMDHAGGRRLAAGWLWLALLSLVGSGLVVILVVVARTPVLHEFLPWLNSFRTALVVHVDLSVLVWFLAFAALLAALNRKAAITGMGGMALALAGAGTLLVTLSPLLAAHEPYMNNYVPVLAGNTPFFLGLLLLAAGFALMAVMGLTYDRGHGVAGLGIVLALAIALLALAMLAWTWAVLPRTIEGDHYYELLFWSAGHVLQFTHTELQIVVWLWLAVAAGLTLPGSPGLYRGLLLLGALPVLAAPVLQHLHDVDSIDHRQAFTALMQFGNGLGVVPVAALLLVAWFRSAPVSPQARVLKNALAASLMLFAAGGVLGFLIQGVNVTIPAHYHGSIVSVTLAYMGLTYHLLPRLGYRAPQSRWLHWQPWLYGGGSLIHALGLAWSGFYGIQRKTAGAEQGLKTFQEKLAMGIGGTGGLVAVVGGILFLVIVFRAMSGGRNQQGEA